MKIIELSQRTPEWHRWRDQGVSASEAIVVLGRCPHKTPYRLYTDKKGLSLPENLDGNFYVLRGIEWESAARASFEARHNAILFPLCAESDEWPFLRASFDGVDEEGRPVELKVPMPCNYDDIAQNGEESKLYRRYYCQVQQQIAVAEADFGWLSFYAGTKRPAIDFKIQRDDALIAELVDKARAFHLALINNQPPLPNPERDLFTPQSVKDVSTWNHMAATYHRLQNRIDEAKASLKELEREQADVEQSLVALMGEYTQAEYAGVRVNRYMQQGAVDYKAALASLAANVDQELLETFRKPGSERVRITTKTQEKATVPFDMDEVLASKGSEFWF